MYMEHDTSKIGFAVNLVDSSLRYSTLDSFSVSPAVCVVCSFLSVGSQGYEASKRSFRTIQELSEKTRKSFW